MESNTRTAINDLPAGTGTQQYQLQNSQSHQNYDDSNEHLGETNVRIVSMSTDETQRAQFTPYDTTEQAITQQNLQVEHPSDINGFNSINDQDEREDLNDVGSKHDVKSDGGFNDFEDEEDKAPESGYDRKRYMEIVRAEHFNNPRRAIFYELRDYKFPETSAKVDNTKKFIYIHHYRFNDNLSKPIEQKILKFYPAGLEGTKRTTIIKDGDGNEIVSFIIGSEDVRSFKEYRCYPVDYRISELKGESTLDKTSGLSRIHAIIQGIDSVILDDTKPMQVIDVSNALAFSGFLIKRAKDFEIYASTCLKAPGRGLILEVVEANWEWITIKTMFDDFKSSQVIKVKDSPTGEWTILDATMKLDATIKSEGAKNVKDSLIEECANLDATTKSEGAKIVEISPITSNQKESTALTPADSPDMLGWLVYNANTKRWYIRNKRSPKEVSGLWLKSKNGTTHDLGDQYTLYHDDYLLIHKHFFTITRNYKFDLFHT